MEEAVNANGPDPSTSNSCDLHQAVFKNDLPGLSALLRGIKEKTNKVCSIHIKCLKLLSSIPD